MEDLDNSILIIQFEVISDIVGGFESNVSFLLQLFRRERGPNVDSLPRSFFIAKERVVGFWQDLGKKLADRFVS